jgi:putative Holliday junction resolvase
VSRVVGIDYGMKRCGIAATDVLNIAVHGVGTVEKSELLSFLEGYMTDNDVEKIVIGHPELESGRITPVVQSLQDFVSKLRLKFKTLDVVFHDESFSSANAAQIIFESGAKKKKRREKGLVDKISAVLILQDYLGHL